MGWGTGDTCRFLLFFHFCLPPSQSASRCATDCSPLCAHVCLCVCACDVGKDPDKHGVAEWTQLSQKVVVWELSVLAYL